MVSFCLDGSGLAKRYVPESGSALVDFVLDQVAEHRIYILNVSYAEVVSVLVRKQNAGTLSGGQFNQALLDFEREVIQSPGKHLLAFDNSVATDALALIVKHAINATDAIVLRVALDIAQHLRSGGDDPRDAAQDLQRIQGPPPGGAVGAQRQVGAARDAGRIRCAAARAPRRHGGTADERGGGVMSRAPFAAPTKLAGRRQRSVKLFISYAHSNRVWMERLSVFLNGLQFDDRLASRGLHYVYAWHDKELTVGNPWDGEIHQELEDMDIFVPLVSPHFFASPYIQNVEVPRVRDRHASGEILVVPILLYDANLREKSAFLHGFSTLPATGRWWNSYPDADDAYRLIDDGLWAAIDEALKRKGTKKR